MKRTLFIPFAFAAAVIAACSKLDIVISDEKKDVVTETVIGDYEDEDIDLVPDLDSRLAVDAEKSAIPEDVILNADRTLLVFPHTAAECTLVIESPDELELIPSDGYRLEVRQTGPNAFSVSKGLYAPGVEGLVTELRFRRKGLQHAYPQDRIVLELSPNPTVMEGILDFREDFTFDFGRYADNDELKYSLRSIEKYAPWIHRIFIVTDNQTPAWLDTSDPKIRIVDHSEIMPAVSRPCFNATVIEHFICDIPGLAEHFLFANDDMFINRPVTPETVFAEDGLPIIRFNRRPFRKFTLWYKEKVQGKKLSNYIQIIRNAAELVERKYGKYYGGKTHHNIDAYLKSDCQHVERMFRKEIEPTLTNHVRSANDIQRNLFAYVALAEKRAHLHYVGQRTSFRLHIQNESHYAKLERYNPMLFCMNDSQYAGDADREREKEWLERRFPEKSRFEK